MSLLQEDARQASHQHQCRSGSSILLSAIGLSSSLEKLKKSGEEVVKRGQEIATTALSLQALLAAQVETVRELTVVRGAEAAHSNGENDAMGVSDEGAS